MTINNTILFSISLSFIYPVALVSNIYLFDILIALFILLNMYHQKFFLDIFSKNIIIIGSFGIFLSLLFVLFSNEPKDALFFILQLIFVTIAIPLFLLILIEKKLFIRFLKYLFFSMVFLLLLVLISFLNKILTGSTEFLHIYYGWGTLRLAIGYFLPGDLNHYFVFSLFLSSIFISELIYKRVFTITSFMLFILTQSKTIVLSILLYLIKFDKKLFILGLIGTFYLFYNNLHEIQVLERVSRIATADYDGGGTDAQRIQMIKDVVNNIDNFLFFPLYNDMNNFEYTSVTRISSTHNIVFSILANLGILSFLFYLIILTIIVFKTQKTFNWVIYFLFLDALTLMVNPLMTNRIAWLPLYVYLYYFYYYSKKQESIS